MSGKKAVRYTTPLTGCRALQWTKGTHRPVLDTLKLTVFRKIKYVLAKRFYMTNDNYVLVFRGQAGSS